MQSNSCFLYTIIILDIPKENGMNKKRLRVAKKSPMFEKRLFLGYVSSRWVLYQSVLQQLF